ncbi:hypothetical protein B0A53_04631 [Rhodotorula sp. CCFEE 5036]|nr:hypothetical protein B0A53_04631 [Rhodotorula sp. CCFEE 5036]
MADERVQPSVAFQQLAKRRAHPSESQPGRDHLYAFKCKAAPFLLTLHIYAGSSPGPPADHGKPASVDPDKPATVFQAPPPDQTATIWAAHPTKRAGGEHRFTATETPAKEYEVALIWDPVAQTWLLEPLDSHFTFKLDRSSKPPPPKTPAVPTEDELHAHAKSFFSSSAPNPFSSFPFSYSVTAHLASLLNPLSASSPSHHPATFSPVNAAASAEKRRKPSSSPRAASSPNPSRNLPERVAPPRAEVEDFGEIPSSSSLGVSQKPVSPSTLRGVATAGAPPSSSSSPRQQQPPHPSYGAKVPASYAARQAAAAAAAAAAAEQQKRLERELKAMDSSPSSSSSSSSDEDEDEWQPVTIVPGGDRRQQEGEDDDDDDDSGGGGRKQRPRKRSRGGAAVANVHAGGGGAAAAGPSARTRQTRSGRAVDVVVHPQPQSHAHAPADRPAPAVRPDLLRAATTTATSAIQRVAPNIDSDSESAESDDDDDEDASSAEDGDGSSADHYPRIMTAAAVQQQQQQHAARASTAAAAAAATTTTPGAVIVTQQQPPAQGPPPPSSSRHHKPRPSLPPPRNSDEARQLAEREADIPDSSEED